MRSGKRGVPSKRGGSSRFSRRTITSPSCSRLGRHAAGEALVVEQLEQRGEALRVAVVRRRREEQPVLEVRRELAQRRVRCESVA